MIETAKANGLEPYVYFKHMITELLKASSVEGVEALLLFKSKTELEQMAKIQHILF